MAPASSSATGARRVSCGASSKLRARADPPRIAGIAARAVRGSRMEERAGLVETVPRLESWKKKNRWKN